MTQEQFDAWIAAQGGPSAVQHSKTNKTIPNPAKTGLQAGNSATPDTITVSTLTWVNKKTGAKLSLIPDGPGNYTIANEDEGEGAGAVGTAAQAGTPAQVADAEAQAAQDLKEKQANQARAEDDNPAYETNAVRETRLGKKTADADTKAAKDKAAADKDKADADAKNKPAITYRQIGSKTYKVLTYPDGREEVSESALPPDVKDEQLEKIDGQPARVVRDPAGKVTGVEIIPVTGGGTDPTFRGSQPSWIDPEIAADLDKYSKELEAAVNSGAITRPRATALMDARHKEAQVAADNQITAAAGVYSGGVTQRGQDVSLANQRLSTSSSNFQHASTVSQKMNDWVDEGSDAGWRLFQYLRRAAMEDAQAYGGLKDLPTVQPTAPLARAAGITVTSPDGTVVSVPSSAAPEPAPPIEPVVLPPVESAPPVPAQAPVVMPPAPPVAPAEMPLAPPIPAVTGAAPTPAQTFARMEAPASGVAAVDALGRPPGRPDGMPTTFQDMEQTFRDLGMSEEAIQASRRNFMGMGQGQGVAA